MSNKPTNALELALAYLKRHPTRYLFPLKRGSKSQPLIKDNLAQASNDPAQISAWAKQFENCNWGISLKKSNCIAVDVDTKAGKKGQTNWDMLDLEYGWPETERIRTPSGGFHDLYEGEHVMAVNGFGLNVDSPNFVVMPGCPRADGALYTLERDIPAAAAPEWFYGPELLGKAKTKQLDVGDKLVDEDKDYNVQWAIDFLKTDAEPAIEGQGGDFTTLKTAMSLRDKAIAFETAVDLMWQYYNDRCVPPWDYEALRKKVENGYAYASQSRMGETTAEATFPDDDVDLDTIKTAIPQTILDRPTINYGNGEHVDLALLDVYAALREEAAKFKNGSGGSTVEDQIFQRAGMLVHLSRNLPKDNEAIGGVQFSDDQPLSIVPITDHWLGLRLTRAMTFKGVKYKKIVKIPVPDALVKKMLADSTHWTENGIPELNGIIEAPTLRKDGTVLQEKGYDPATKLFYDPSKLEFDRIDDADLTFEKGKEALRYIADEALYAFPFKDEQGDEGLSLSVALAAICTATVRRSLKIAPAFAFDSNEPESGKTQLANVANVFAMGPPGAIHSFSDSAEERRKVIGSALLAGEHTLAFDDVPTPLECKNLERLITAPTFKDRPLGVSKLLELPTNVLVLFTANHLTVGGNGLSTRILVSRIVPDADLAARIKRGDFRKHPDLDRWVVANRPALIAKALTALRTFQLHGKSAGAGSSASRFPEWSGMVADALIWYGYRDPARGGDTVRRDDSVKEGQRSVAEAWWKAFGEGAATAKELQACLEVREAIRGVTGKRDTDITVQIVSDYTKKMVGVDVGLSMKVQRVPDYRKRRHEARWQLVSDIDVADLLGEAAE